MHKISKICEVCRVSRKSYYDYLHSKEKREKKRESEEKIVREIRRIWEESNKTYGSPRVAIVLNQGGQKTCQKKVARLMSSYGIKSIRVKKNRKKPEKIEEAEKNLILGKKLTGINQVWVSDITYIWTGHRWEYLSSIMDLYSRKIIAYIFSNHMTSELVEATLKLALSRRKPVTELIFHSDKGSQYRSKSFKKLLKDNNIAQSICGKGNCYENAAMESFHATIKREMIYVKNIRDSETMRMEIFKFIEGFYNRRRIHSSLKYVSPEIFEQNLKSQNIKRER